MGDPIHEFDHDGFRHTLESREGGGYDLFRWVRGARLWPLRDSIYPALLRELARLATQKAESLPDGSREFEDRFTGKRWRISLSECGAPQLFHLTADAPPFLTSLGATGTPFVQVLAEQFAALGREQGFAQKKERNDFCRQLAALEGDGRTEGADVEMAAVYDGGNGGGYEPHVRLYVRRGDRIYILAEDRGRYDRQTGAELSPPNREWVQLPPLPPIEPAKAGAEEREADPLGLARHDWRTHRGHVSCERCGAPFSEVWKDQACGAQP